MAGVLERGFGPFPVMPHRAGGSVLETPARKWRGGSPVRPDKYADDGQDRALALGWGLATQPT